MRSYGTGVWAGGWLAAFALAVEAPSCLLKHREEEISLLLLAAL